MERFALIIAAVRKRLNWNSEPPNGTAIPCRFPHGDKRHSVKVMYRIHSLLFTHSGKNETSHRKGHSVHLQSVIPAPRWSSSRLCLCKIHYYSCTMFTIRHDGYHYTSSLYAGAPDRRPPLSSGVSILWIELKRRAKLQTGVTLKWTN